MEVDPSYKLRREIEEKMHELAELGWKANDIEEFCQDVLDSIRDDEEDDDDE